MSITQKWLIFGITYNLMGIITPKPKNSSRLLVTTQSSITYQEDYQQDLHEKAAKVNQFLNALFIPLAILVLIWCIYNIWKRRKTRRLEKIKRKLALERIRKGELVCSGGHPLDRKVRGVKELYKKGLAKKHNRVYCNKCQSNLGLTRHVYRCSKFCKFNLCRWCFKSAQQAKYKRAERMVQYKKERRRIAYMRRVRAKTARIGLRKARVLKKRMVLAKIMQLFKFRQNEDIKRSQFEKKGGAAKGGNRGWMTVELDAKTMTFGLTQDPSGNGNAGGGRKKMSVFGRNQIMEENESGDESSGFSVTTDEECKDLFFV